MLFGIIHVLTFENEQERKHPSVSTGDSRCRCGRTAAQPRRPSTTKMSSRKLVYSGSGKHQSPPIPEFTRLQKMQDHLGRGISSTGRPAFCHAWNPPRKG